MPQCDCFCIFNTDTEQLITATAIHRFWTFPINKYHASYWFVCWNITFLKDYFSTKISIVKKFLINSDDLPDKRNVSNNYFLRGITDADGSLKQNYWLKM